MGKVLIIDPSLLDRKRIRNVLEAAGHAVLEMASPAEAMRELATLPWGTVKLILTELHFDDGLTGLEFVKWLKNQDQLRSIPVLVVTPQPPREVLIEMVSAGASTIIPKPFGADLMLRRVTETLAEQSLLMQGTGGSLTWNISDFLRRELKRAERSGGHFSVVACRPHDQMGGRALPLLLGGLARIMRESDILARIGAEQVMVLLPDTDLIGASVVETRIWKVVQELAQEKPDRPAVRLDVSTGVATFPTEATDGESLVSLAYERALSQGKA